MLDIHYITLQHYIAWTIFLVTCGVTSICEGPPIYRVGLILADMLYLPLRLIELHNHMPKPVSSKCMNCVEPAFMIFPCKYCLHDEMEAI